MPYLQYLKQPVGEQMKLDQLALRGLGFARRANVLWDQICDECRDPDNTALEAQFARMNRFAGKLIGHGGIAEISPVVTDPLNEVVESDIP